MRFVITLISLFTLLSCLTGRSATAHEPMTPAERDSIADLGYRLYFGSDSLQPDPARATILIRRAAEEGNTRAANNLGFILLHGDSASRNPAEALHWLTVASDAGLPTAISQLGDLYRDGLGTAADSLRADSLYTLAASRGLRDADYKLADLNKSRWLCLAPDSLLRLGQRYNAAGLFASAAQALTYAARGSESLQADVAAAAVPPQATALMLLSDAYSLARGVPYSYEKAVSALFDAATLGDPSAQFFLGEALDLSPDFLSPIGIRSADYLSDPALWYRLAARAGIDSAHEAKSRLYPKPSTTSKP